MATLGKTISSEYVAHNERAMRAFDQLPRELQRFLRRSPYDMCPIKVLGRLVRNQGDAQLTIRQLKAWIDKVPPPNYS